MDREDLAELLDARDKLCAFCENDESDCSAHLKMAGSNLW